MLAPWVWNTVIGAAVVVLLAAGGMIWFVWTDPSFGGRRGKEIGNWITPPKRTLAVKALDTMWMLGFAVVGYILLVGWLLLASWLSGSILNPYAGY